MTDFRKLLTPFVGVVIALFGIFNGFLMRIAPPDATGLAFAVGIVPFLVLLVLLFIAAASRHTSAPGSGRLWVACGAVLAVSAIPAAFVYPLTFNKYTYLPPGSGQTRHVCASSEYLTPEARRYVRENPNDASPARLSRNFPSDESIWEKKGLEIAQQRLLAAYAWLVLTLCSAILCLLEAISGGTMTSIRVRRRVAAAAGRNGSLMREGLGPGR